MAKTILVVEDEVIRHVPVENALREAGYDTRWTDASGMAWEYLDRNVYAPALSGTKAKWDSLPGGYSLVVLDVDEIRAAPRGPPLRGEGMRLLGRLRRDPKFSKKELPVIGMSHWLPVGSASWEGQFLEAGGNAFFEWPFDLGDLVEEVKRLIG